MASLPIPLYDTSTHSFGIKGCKPVVLLKHAALTTKLVEYRFFLQLPYRNFVVHFKLYT